MIVFRRRLLYWLIKEYIRKWGKALLLAFVVGLLLFFLFLHLIRTFLPKIPLNKHESIGVVGAYTLENLPQSILSDLSMGLTTVSPNGTITAGLAKEWKVENNDKRYTFYLKRDLFFSDKTRVTSNTISYNFSDVTVSRPDSYTIRFDLKDKYSPFLVSVGRPVFKKDFIGVGKYTIRDIKLNGNFIESLTLAEVQNQYSIKIYQFYPTITALKTAYVLGEVSIIYGLPDFSYKDTSFADFPNAQIKKNINYNQLVTLFYNTQDKVLSDKILRNALSYALPDTFNEGKRSSLPYAPQLWAYADTYAVTQDIERAKILLSASAIGTKSAEINVEIKTLPRFESTAEEIAKSWGKIGIKTNVVYINTVPSEFQIFLGDFFVPKDPDQYTLWHADQENNITRYNNQRIDKLLEDGRKTVDIEERKKIYADFQKYLTADAPASFLYFPYEYEIRRKK